MKSKLFFLTIFILILSFSSFAQKSGKKYYITGQVLDLDNKPVSGAMVLIDNKSTDVITNDSGKYKVKVKPNAAIISIVNLSSGVINEEINGRIVINFNLNIVVPSVNMTKQESADNEVVNIGYGSVQKKDLATGAGNIDGQNSKFASCQSVYDIIKMEVPGATVVGSQVTLRGVGTINGKSDPLFLVDGIEVKDLENISPRTVKSINVLTGSDASIYGAKAANGVIMISLVKNNK